MRSATCNTSGRPLIECSNLRGKRVDSRRQGTMIAVVLMGRMPNADRVVFELQADLGTRHFLRLNSMETNESTGSAQLVKELLVQNKMGIHARPAAMIVRIRSEEHTSELQSRENLVCRLLLEK